MNEFLPYSKFHTASDAEWLITLLNEEGIPYHFEHQANQLDDLIIGNGLDPMFLIKIQSSDFTRVNELIEKTTPIEESENYYLYQLSDKELVDVVNDPVNWNAYDQGLAKQILNKRKVGFTEPTAKFSSNYISEEIPTATLILGYLLSTTIIGVLFGLSILQNKKILPDGTKVFTYDEDSRKHGKFMMWIALIALTLFISKLI